MQTTGDCHEVWTGRPKRWAMHWDNGDAESATMSVLKAGGLATAHSIHNGLTALAETHAFYHGEKVAFGVLTGLQLADATPQESDTVSGRHEKKR